MKRIRKAVASLYSSATPLIAAGVTWGVWDNTQAHWIAGLLAAVTPLLTFLGVYSAKPNVP